MTNDTYPAHSQPEPRALQRLTPATYAEHEAAVITRATAFIACDYRGRATYVKADRPTRKGAVMAARQLIGRRDPKDVFNKGRPVLVYAWDGMYQVLSDTVYP